MGIFKRNSGSSDNGETGSGGDPRDMIGRNPTGLSRKSSAGQRRKAARRLDKDLEGTVYEKKEDDK